MVAIPRKRRGLDDAGGDARLEHLTVPVAVRGVDEASGIRARDNFSYVLLYFLERLPITAGGQSISTFPVGVARLGTPGPGANALDQFRRDAIALDRQRVIGIALVDFLDEREIGLGVRRQAGRFRKAVDHGFAQRTPQGLETAYDGRQAGCELCEALLRREGIGEARIMARRPHRFDDFIGDILAPNAGEGPSEPAGGTRVSAFQQTVEDLGSIFNSREHDLHFKRIPGECQNRKRNPAVVATLLRSRKPFASPPLSEVDMMPR